MRVALAGLFVTAILLALATPAAAADIRSGDVTIAQSETINDDLYVFGNNINILGTVRGDVIAAGSIVTIAGMVTGNVNAAGNAITVSGHVVGSVRAAGNTIAIDGRVEGDVVAAGSTVAVSSGAQIGRDLISGTGSVTISGPVGRDVRGSAGTLVIDGHVGRDATVEVTTLRLTDRAVVDGSVSYGSKNEAIRAPGAVVQGKFERREPQNAAPVTPAPTATAIDLLKGLAGLLILGLLLVVLVPGFMRRTSEALAVNPWASVGLGVAVLIGIPIFAVLAFIVGAFIGGWWIGLVALALYLAAIAISLPVAAVAIGRWVLARVNLARDLPVALVVGVIVLVLLSVIPYVGGLIAFFACLLGLGAMALAITSARDVAPAATAR